MKKKYIKIILSIIMIVVLIICFLLIPDHKSNQEIIDNADIYDYSLIHRNYYYSYEDKLYTSIAGIDVSEHNLAIDYKKVKESGIDFVYLRIGWRGYSEGKLHEDVYFKTNYNNVTANNLLVGAYFFSQAVNEDEAIEEANYLLNILNGRKLDLPIIYDFEYIDYDDARSDGLTKEQCTKNALAFFETIKQAKDYEVGLYANSKLLNDYYDMEILKDYFLWYAQYYDVPQCPYQFQIWQYSENAIVPGCSKETDLNIMFIPK